MIKAIIFDVYGTLISTGTGSVDACAQILRQINSSLDATGFYAKWKELHRKNIDNWIEQSTAGHFEGFKTESQIFFEDLVELYQIHGINSDAARDVGIMLKSTWNRKAFDDALGTLNKLLGKYRIVLGSTSDSISLYANIAQNKLKVGHIHTSESLKAYKPQREFYLKILDKECLSPSEAIFVGDSLIDDVFGPQRVGIRSILLDRKRAFKPSNIMPDAVICSLFELESAIDGLS